MIQGKTPVSTVENIANANPLLKVAVGSQVATLTAATIAEQGINTQAAKTGQTFNIVGSTFTGTMALPRTAGATNFRDAFLGKPSTTVNINVNKADPKATVDAVSAYLKQNGSLPFTGKAGR